MQYQQMTLKGINTFILTDQVETDKSSRYASLSDKIEESKAALRLAAEMSLYYYQKPLIITYSGGKDSDVMLHLAESCLEPNEFEVLNSHTTVDAPETVYHIRSVFKRLNDKGIKTSIDYHKTENGNITMWSLIPERRMPPTRIVRYCCQQLKETGTPNRICALGVRGEESTNREGRDLFAISKGSKRDFQYYSLEHSQEVHHEAVEINDPVYDCTLIKTMRNHGDTIVNPIYNWTTHDIWDYIKSNDLTVNPLYAKGYPRVGCIGCPLASYKQKIKEFNDYPKYKTLYIQAFEKMIQARKDNNLDVEWNTGQEVFDWWIEESKHNIKGQMTMEDMLNE